MILFEKNNIFGDSKRYVNGMIFKKSYSRTTIYLQWLYYNLLFLLITNYLNLIHNITG